MLNRFNLLCEEILKGIDTTKYIPVKFIDGTEAIGTDYNGNSQPWLMRINSI
jgi:hypothetical protein